MVNDDRPLGTESSKTVVAALVSHQILTALSCKSTPSAVWVAAHSKHPVFPSLRYLTIVEGNHAATLVLLKPMLRFAAERKAQVTPKLWC